MNALDRSHQNAANNRREWSCPFCDFEGTVSDRVRHLLDHE